MKRNGWAAVVTAILLLARSSGEAQTCSPQPFGVDPAYGNFTPTTWVEQDDLSWVNNAVGAQFFGVWANSDFDMWFVGGMGLEESLISIAAHFDGFSVRPIRVSGSGLLYAVWGSGSNDVWAVGLRGTIVHWDGTGWVSVPSGTVESLYAVAGTAPDDVWAASDRVMLHWDGVSWARSDSFVPGPQDRGGTGLAAISRTDALVATYQGCQRWDGAAWNSTPCGVQGGRGIFAVGSDDIWVVGWTGYLGSTTAYRAHWDGASWTTTSAAEKRWGNIVGTGPSDIWIDGTMHFDGTTWTETSCGPLFSAMSVSNNGALMGVNRLGIEYFSGNDGWLFLARTYVGWVGVGGRDPTNLFAVGAKGAVIRYDGSRWSGQDYPLPREDDNLSAIFGSSPSDIWGSTPRNGWRHFDGRGWRSVDSPQTAFATGFARAPNDAIAVDGDRRHWHWDGTSWWEITLPIFGTDYILEFWGTGPDDAWAVGGSGERNGSIYHWDGDSWRLAYSPRWVSHVGGSARDDVWFTMDYIEDTSVLHWDGTSFREVGFFRGPLSGIAATSPSDVWVMSHGLLRHYDGGAWSSEPINPLLSSMWAVPGAGVFFTRPYGHIYQAE
jgi:hypothetical protein